MAVTATIDRHISGIGTTKSQATAYSSSSALDIEEDIPDAGTETEIVAAIDVSEAKAIYIHSTEDVELSTNASEAGAPDNTILLLADIPYLWTYDGYAVNLLTVDVTSIFFDNNSGSTATITIKVLQDATPA